MKLAIEGGGRETLGYLIDQFGLMDSEDMMRNLVNYHQCHISGLQMLSIQCSNLDSFITLEHQYEVQSRLLALQRECTLEDACESEQTTPEPEAGSSEQSAPVRFWRDDASLMRNRILVRAFVCVYSSSASRLPHGLLGVTVNDTSRQSI